MIYEKWILDANGLLTNVVGTHARTQGIVQNLANLTCTSHFEAESIHHHECLCHKKQLTLFSSEQRETMVTDINEIPDGGYVECY